MLGSVPSNPGGGGMGLSTFTSSVVLFFLGVCIFSVLIMGALSIVSCCVLFLLRLRGNGGDSICVVSLSCILSCIACVSFCGVSGNGRDA